jgi:hypothetical protein
MHGGMHAITEPNDPFWNVRALDTALSEHGGYVTTPLICALDQLAMDNIVLQKNDSGQAAGTNAYKN